MSTPTLPRKRLAVRPSALFWAQFQRVCTIGFFVCLVIGVIGVLVFRQGWFAIGPAAMAFGSQTGNIAGLVQRTGELRAGYTTIPWLAFDVELWDAKTHSLLIPAGERPKDILTIQQARTFASERGRVAAQPADHATAEARRLDPAVQQPDSTVPIDGDGEGLKLALLLTAVGVAVAAIATFLYFGFTSGDPATRSFLYLVGVLAGVGLALIVCVFVLRMPTARIKRGDVALRRGFPLLQVIAVRPAVETYGGLGAKARKQLRSSMLLSVAADEVALWSCTSKLVKVVSIATDGGVTPTVGRAHDTRGNEAAALSLPLASSGELVLFVRAQGCAALWPANEGTTASAKSLIASATR